jgi:uncharacterized oligopeptide transporter (OPT) family protein
MHEQYPIGPSPRSGLERFIGGTPMGVVIRLALLSLVVGFFMTIFGFSPTDLIDAFINFLHSTFRDGFGLFRDIGAYILTGAAIVVPVWLIIRVVKARP